MTPRAARHKSLRRVILLHPFELPLAVCLLAIAVVFTAFPDVLEHSPINFEARGIVHHAWHYALLLGGALTVIGLFAIGPRCLGVELAGLTLLLMCIALNFTALIAGEIDGSGRDALSGMDAALRVAAIVAIGVRMWIIATRPTVTMTASRDA
jgi:hypothetical protein